MYSVSERAEIIRCAFEARALCTALQTTLTDLRDEATVLRTESVRLRARAQGLRRLGEVRRSGGAGLFERPPR